MPTIWEALVPILFLIGALILNFSLFGDAGLDGSIQTILILATAITGLVGARLGIKWDQMIEGMVNTISSAMPSILILLFIGALSGTWLISGIVPSMIYYGLKILNPTIFLFASCIICAIVSVASGSSWSTVGTVGIALLGIGTTLGFEQGMVAGAIISGAYFGDKISPLSETTNLAPAVAGTDLISHIRYMLFTTVPTISITLVIFIILGFTAHDGSGTVNVDSVMVALENKFNLNPILFIVPVGVFFMIAKRVPAIPALLVGAISAAILAIFFQPEAIREVAGHELSFGLASLKAVMMAGFGSISLTTENEIVNELLSSGGMAGMLNTIWLILTAMCFGGMMEATGLLHKLTSTIMRAIKTDASLVGCTGFSSIFINFATSDQYLSVVLPGKMYQEAFEERGLDPVNLSRTLEDCGTVTSPLIPWNSCSVYHSTVLSVNPMAFIGYCFFNLISPIMTMIFIIFNIKIKRLKKELA
ncbi:Na+/H+ antiporter NhaC [Sediminitomix flava]|uniref:Transporter (NhaC family) n=1 Tax=Sediminitomix flava TaxID=379075 RepID=A0A315ZJQ2_SEDFL|nr:Na+/H+ antiporter NhaC [Sediminitomix flava]PWJ45058.1 transporter (NhaC family) [Sediminitomix flava]